jgi:hypothetical protein
MSHGRVKSNQSCWANNDFHEVPENCEDLMARSCSRVKLTFSAFEIVVLDRSAFHSSLSSNPSRHDRRRPSGEDKSTAKSRLTA